MIYYFFVHTEKKAERDQQHAPWLTATTIYLLTVDASSSSSNSKKLRHRPCRTAVQRSVAQAGLIPMQVPGSDHIPHQLTNRLAGGSRQRSFNVERKADQR